MKFFRTQLIPLSYTAGFFKIAFWGIGKLVRAIFGKKFHYPLAGMQEDPMYFPSRETWYLGYKYFYRHLLVADRHSNLENYFAQQEFIPYKPQSNARTLTFSVGGDLMPYEMINPVNASTFWDEKGGFLFNADLAFANLETPIDTDRPTTYVKELMLSDVYFNAAEDVFDLFNGGKKHRGFDILGVANNHSMDCGEKGIKSTMDFLERKKIVYTGAQQKKEDHFKPVYVERNGIRLAFISCTYSLNREVAPEGKEWLVNHLRLNMPGVDITPLKQAAEEARKNADLIIFSLHCGNAYQAYPGLHITELFHRIFNECGADLILGHHGHNPQPMESYKFTCPFTGKEKNGFAIYSLGDLMAYDFNLYCHFPVLLKFTLVKDDNGCGISAVEAMQGIISLIDHPANTRIRLLNLRELHENGYSHPGMTNKGVRKAKYLYQYHRKYLDTIKGVQWV